MVGIHRVHRRFWGLGLRHSFGIRLVSCTAPDAMVLFSHAPAPSDRKIVSFFPELEMSLV